MLYFVFKGEKSGMHSHRKKDKKEKLYCFENDLDEFLQDSIVLLYFILLSIGKVKLLIHIYRSINNPP